MITPKNKFRNALHTATGLNTLNLRKNFIGLKRNSFRPYGAYESHSPTAPVSHIEFFYAIQLLLQNPKFLVGYDAEVV